MKTFQIYCALALGLALSSAAHAATFVLVHGAWGDAGAWGAIVPALQKQGHTVRSINLPGQGRDATPVNQIGLNEHVQTIETAIREEKEPVVLVGHSLSGMLISQVAENMPERVARLVYVAAFLPQDGDSALALLKRDEQSSLGRDLDVSSDHTRAGIRPSGRVLAVCDDCPVAVQDALAGNDRVEPMRPFSDTVQLSTARFGRVSKSYIYTQNDKALGYDLQTWMVKRNASVELSAVLSTSHLPFLAQPDAFVTRLLYVSGL